MNACTCDSQYWPTQPSIVVDLDERGARHLVVVAGCNGAGKTTYVGLRNDFRDYAGLDPDALYARFGSWRIVSRAIGMAFASHNDVVLETTFSGRRVIERTRKAKDDGFNVTLIFIGTASPAINIKRVAKRVREGGHDVPREDVLRRWPRSLENLLQHYQIADQLLILDNSSERFRFAMVAKREGDGSTPIFRDPRWALRNRAVGLFRRSNAHRTYRAIRYDRDTGSCAA